MVGPAVRPAVQLPPSPAGYRATGARAGAPHEWGRWGESRGAPPSVHPIKQYGLDTTECWA